MLSDEKVIDNICLSIIKNVSSCSTSSDILWLQLSGKMKDDLKLSISARVMHLRVHVLALKQ